MDFVEISIHVKISREIIKIVIEHIISKANKRGGEGREGGKKGEGHRRREEEGRGVERERETNQFKK